MQRDVDHNNQVCQAKHSQHEWWMLHTAVYIQAELVTNGRMHTSDRAGHSTMTSRVHGTCAVLQSDESLKVGGGVEAASLTANIDTVEGGGRGKRRK